MDRKVFLSHNEEEIDYNNIGLLKGFVTESWKIIPARVSGASSKIQRKLARSIRIARYLALIPYCDIHWLDD